MTKISELTRPIVGMENRTAQEVFDIMADRFRQLDKEQESGHSQPSVSHGSPQIAGVMPRELLNHLAKMTGYYITTPPTPDHELVKVCNGDLRVMTDLLNDVLDGALETQEEEAVAPETRLAQLEEIADGAWGDNPMVRGKARDEAARLRSSAHPTAVQKEEEGQTVSEDIVDRILAECPRYAVKQSHMGTEPNGKWLQVSDVRAALTAALVKP